MKNPPRLDLKALLSPIAEDMRKVDAIIRERLSSEVALINQIGAHIVSAGGKPVTRIDRMSEPSRNWRVDESTWDA